MPDSRKRKSEGAKIHENNRITKIFQDSWLLNNVLPFDFKFRQIPCTTFFVAFNPYNKEGPEQNLSNLEVEDAEGL